ncbi:RGCVC family protein [Saccharopolyspora soli]|uniref:RGCVC family protein n=1 Tax=Saccharopolyspora soli TaxID=2926618 RepID=UPI003557A883
MRKTVAMTSNSALSSGSELHTDDGNQLCAVCPHIWIAHDPIAVRYCTATMSRALTRGCVCRDQPTND